MKRLALLVAIGCAHSTPVRPETAREEISALLHAQYAAVERGDLAAWSTAFDDNVFLIGSDPDEAMVGKAAILAHLSRAAAARMRSDVHRSYKSTALHIAVAPSGQSAWLSDEIEYSLS